jgi:hypothetical protein
MKNIRDLNARIVLPALMAAILSFGCATPGSKGGAKTNASQTASARPVILVPVFILSPQDNGTNGSDQLPARDPAPPEQSIQGWPALPMELPTRL